MERVSPWSNWECYLGFSSHWIEIFHAWYAGGTFALYSLICRHAKVSLLPNRQVADEALSTYKLEHPPEQKNSSRVKAVLEKHKVLHTALLILVLLGTCMVIGDGLLTPAISGILFSLFSISNLQLLPPCFLIDDFCLYIVFSAVSGLELSMSKEHHQCKHLELYWLWCYYM